MLNSDFLVRREVCHLLLVCLSVQTKHAYDKGSATQMESANVFILFLL